MFATTRIAVYRDTAANDYGDTDDDNRKPEPGLERVPVALTERTRTVYDSALSELRTIRTGVLRAKPGTDLQPDDRILDLSTNRWWRLRATPLDGRSAIGTRTLSFDLKGA